MRVVMIIILLGIGLWQGAADWRATIGQGYAYRFTTFGQAISENWPHRFAGIVVDGAPRAATNPILSGLLSLPVAAALLVLAGLLWLTRRRRR